MTSPLDVMRTLAGTQWSSGPPTGKLRDCIEEIAAAYPEMANYVRQAELHYLAWCGLMCGYCHMRAGIRPPFNLHNETQSFLWAMAWASWGSDAMADPQQGDVAVFAWHSGGHHVTIIDEVQGDSFKCFGGNQSHEVNDEPMPRSSCAAVRRPPAVLQSIQTQSPILVPVEPSPPLAPVLLGSLDPHTQRIRQFVIEETGISAELESAKAGWLAELDTLKTKIAAFSLTVAPPQPASDPTPAPQTSATYTDIIATVFGGPSDSESGSRTAYSDVAAQWWNRPGCALPYRFENTRPMVAAYNKAAGHGIIMPIIDVGPIYPSRRGPADPYWITGSRPRAEIQHVLSQAGIDLTPAAARALGIDGKGKVDWHFIGPSSSPTTFTPPAMGTTKGDSSMDSLPPFLVNWKTTSAGGLALVGAVGDIAVQISTGHFDPTRLMTDFGVIAAGLGLVSAKDGSVAAGKTG
jgi:hypothetical protein